jgi:hypothetical protein
MECLLGGLECGNGKGYENGPLNKTTSFAHLLLALLQSPWIGVLHTFRLTYSQAIARRWMWILRVIQVCFTSNSSRVVPSSLTLTVVDDKISNSLTSTPNGTLHASCCPEAH